MKRAPRCWRFALLAGALAALPAQAIDSFKVGMLPIAAAQGDLEFPVAGDFHCEAGFALVSQGTFDGGSPFTHLAFVSPRAWLHYDGFTNLRLSAGFQEVLSKAIPELGVPDSHLERLSARARVQQPKGATALYEMVQLDASSFDDPTGVHRWVFHPRLRAGIGFNLDTNRVHSLMLYQEAALRFSEASYTTRAFDFYRSVVGYTWTTKRGLFVTVAVLGQIAQDPAGSSLAVLYGAALSFMYRIVPAAKVADAPPELAEPPEIEPP